MEMTGFSSGFQVYGAVFAVMLGLIRVMLGLTVCG